MILLPLVEEQFKSEIKLCYQKRDAIYGNLVTTRPVPVGDRTYFNRSHAGTPAGQKARFGKIPRNGGSLDRVPCDLQTYYAGDEIDEQEVSSTSADGMLVITDNAMASMNQLTDQIILDAINSTTNTITVASGGFTLDTAKAIWAHYQKNHIFRNKEMPIINLGVEEWDDLMSLNQFYNADVIGYQKLPYLFSEAETGRFWMDMVWRVDPDIPSGGANTNICNAFVRSCVGLALGGVDKTRVLETDDDTILYYMRRKLGAVLIDDTGVLKISVTH